MNKYEELKDYVSSKVLEYQKKFEIAREDFERIGCDETAEKWVKLAQPLQDCLNVLIYEKKKELRLKIYEQKFRAMLEDFYDNGYIFASYVYHAIFKVPNGSLPYKVEDKYFKTLEEAKKYSISLGEDDNWLKYAYSSI